MLGRKIPPDSTVIYLATFPYTRRKTKRDGLSPTPPVFATIQQNFIAHLLRWCLQKNLVKRNPSGEGVLPVSERNIASLSYVLHTHNFQHLVYRKTLDELFAMIADNPSTLNTTALQQLAIALLGLYEPEFIHYHINQTYGAFAAMPLPNPELSWAQIHQQCPFMWVVLTLHLVLKNFTDLT